MRLAALAAALLVATAGAASAQKKKLDAAHEAVAAAIADRASGDLVEPVRFVSLKEDGTASVTFQLDPQLVYWIYSGCAACGVTLTATDNAGSEVDDDTDKDGEADLLIPAKTTTRLKVEVKADSCDQEPCLIGLGLYSN